MENNRYVIEIKVGGDSDDKKQRSQSSAASNADTPSLSNTASEALNWKDSSVYKGAQKIAGFYGATSLVRQAAHAGIGLMSIYTGNDRQQQQIESYMNLAETAVSTGIMFALNPVAGVTYLAGKAISLTAEAIRNSEEMKVQNMSADAIRRRAGGAFNRSRTKESF